MNCKIIADSCCDMTLQLKERLGITSVPLTMMLGDKSFTDDETLNLPGFIEEMKNCLKSSRPLRILSGICATTPYKRLPLLCRLPIPIENPFSV